MAFDLLKGTSEGQKFEIISSELFVTVDHLKVKKLSSNLIAQN